MTLPAERSFGDLPSLPILSGQSLLRAAIIAGTAILCLAVPLAASPMQQLMLVGLIVAGIAALFVLAFPPAGILALIVTAIVVPSPSMPGGLNIAIILLGGLAGLHLLDMAVRQRRIWLVESRLVRPLVALAAVSVLSFAVGQLRWFPFGQYAPLNTQLGGLAIFVLSAGAFLLTAQQVTDLRWLARMVWVFVALSAVYFAGWLADDIGTYTARFFQGGAVANSMFWLWTVTLSLSQALFNRSLPIYGRLALGLAAGGTVYIAYAGNSDWKSGYVPAVVAVGVILALRSWRVALGILMAAPAAMFFILTRAIASDEYSYYSRLDAWAVVMKIVEANPILGLGPANYYWYVQQIPLRGYYIQFNSHNQYVDLIAQVGLAGLICFIWFAVEAALLGWRLRKSAPAGFAQAYVVGILGGLVGMLLAGMLGDWFLPFVYNIGLNGYRGGMLAWLFLGGLVSIEMMVRRQEREKAALDAPIAEEST